MLPGYQDTVKNKTKPNQTKQTGGKWRKGQWQLQMDDNVDSFNKR